MKFILLQMTATTLLATSGAEARWQPFTSLRGSTSSGASMVELGSVCTDLGDAAAEHVVKDNWCTPNSGGTYSTSSFPESCKEVAYSVCEGTIRDVADRWCPNKNMKTSQLLDLQDECEDQVDSMVGNDDRNRDDDNTSSSDPCDPDIIFADQPANTRSSLERSARNGTLKQDNPDVWHDTKQARNRCKQDVGANECKSMGYCFESEMEES